MSLKVLRGRDVTVIRELFAVPTKRGLAVAVLVAGWAAPGLLFSNAAVTWLVCGTGALLVWAVGLGSTVRVGRDGIDVTFTWFGVPYRRERYPLTSNIGLETYLNREPSGVFIVGGCQECVVGAERSAQTWLVALQEAAERARQAARHWGGGPFR